MTPALTQIPFAQVALGFGLGLAFGYLHFTSLYRVTRLLLGGGPVWRSIGLQLARLAALATLLGVLALLGASALLSGLFGVIAAREIVLRRVRKAG